MTGTGPLAMATAVDEFGVRCYTKVADGTVIAEYNQTTQAQIEAAQQNGDIVTMQEIKPWYREKTTFKCDPVSRLCALAWDGASAVFHEYDGQIMYWFDDTMAKNPSKQMSPSIADTGDTDSNLPATSKRHPVPEPANRNHKCMRGTELAVTGNLDGSNLTLFYQDREGYLCCRFAKNWIWAEPVRVVKAVRGTGIAAISWDANQDGRVYYQDENYVINEYRISKEKLTPDAANLADPRALTSLAAVYWRSGETHKIEVRVYFQVGQSGIHEICFISKVQKWQDNSVLFEAVVAQFDIVAFVRGTTFHPVISLWMASKEGRVLLQRAYNGVNAWIPAIAHALPRTDYTD